LNNIVTLKPGL